MLYLSAFYLLFRTMSLVTEAEEKREGGSSSEPIAFVGDTASIPDPLVCVPVYNLQAPNNDLGVSTVPLPRVECLGASVSISSGLMMILDKDVVMARSGAGRPDATSWWSIANSLVSSAPRSS